jgi:hypothetical protein
MLISAFMSLLFTKLGLFSKLTIVFAKKGTPQYFESKIALKRIFLYAFFISKKNTNLFSENTIPFSREKLSLPRF